VMVLLLASSDFEQARGAHAAADTHRDHDVTRAAPLALDERVAHQSRTRHPVRMADADAAAVHVEDVGVDAELIARIDHLAGERLSQLPGADIAHPLAMDL